MKLSTTDIQEQESVRLQYRDRLYQFGSEDSQDRDFFVDIPDNVDVNDKETRMELRKIKSTLRELICGRGGVDSNSVDISFIRIENGYVVWTDRGDVEEVNNCLYHTFNNHVSNMNRHGDNPIQGELKQSVALKAIRVIRGTLTHLSRDAEERNEIKRLLSEGTFTERWDYLVKYLQNDRLIALKSFKESCPRTPTLKSLAMWYAQLYALMNGKVYFNKLDMALAYPEVAQYLYRVENADASDLQNFMVEVLEELINHVQYDGDLDNIKFDSEEHYYSNAKESRA